MTKLEASPKKEEPKVETKHEIDDREKLENDSIQSDEPPSEPTNEPSNQPSFKTRDDSPEPESQELKESKMSEVVGQFSTSKWKPVEKTDSNNSSGTVKKESSDLSHEMDMEMEELKNDELEIDIGEDPAIGLPDLRTVISRPSSISDAESDDYQIRPKFKKSKDTKKKKRKDSLNDKHSRVVSYDRHRTRDDTPERRVKSKKEKKDKKSKKKKAKRSHDSDSDSSGDRRRKMVS